MVVYHLNISLVRFILGASHDYFVNVALMFGILYPRQESNLQLTRLKLVVFTVSPRRYFVDKEGLEPSDSRDYPRTFGQ